MIPTRRFADKVAIVTGGAAGIGRETAFALAREGARVAIADCDAEQGRLTAEALRSEGRQAEFHATDVACPEQVERLVSQVVERWGRLDLAFNNAGLEGVVGLLPEQPLEQIQRLVAVNLMGIIYALKFELPRMAETGGAIVNNASILGLKGLQQASVYVATKHAVVGLTKAVALEGAAWKVRVNAVAPGPIETRMLNEVAAGDLRRFAKHSPLGRIGQPSEVSQAVLWLLSDEASYVTGHTLSVDGGLAAR